MTYFLDLPSIEKNFGLGRDSANISHKAKTRRDFLPFNTKKVGPKNNASFLQVAGEFSRLLAKKEAAAPLDAETLIEEIVEKVEIGESTTGSDLKQLLKTLFFSDGQLHMFHPLVLLYIESTPEVKKIAHFLFDVLRGVVPEEPYDALRHQPRDVLTKLLFENLPALQDRIGDTVRYQNVLPEIGILFAEDFNWLSQKPLMFVEHIERLLTFYYFFYVSQFAYRCDARFNKEKQVIRPVYFNLEWENISQSRMSCEKGWNTLEKSVARLFAHVNTLKLLNYFQGAPGDMLSYQQIGEKIESMSDGERQLLLEQLEKVINTYQQKVNDITWDNNVLNQDEYPDEVLNMANAVFGSIHYQFRVSRRKSESKKYHKWFTDFCNSSFLRSRGRSGKVLILNADFLLFLTKLIIKDQQKIRLVTLFNDFNRRGIAFDRDTQEKIVEYFEAINILDKKSDSGDALYVKSFL